MLRSPEPEVANVDSVFKPTIVLMCGRTVAFAGAFFIPVLLARIFTPEQFGTYKQVFLIYASFYSISQLGMAESLFYFLPRDPRNGGRYVLNAVLILLVGGLACLALLASQQGTLSEWLNNSSLGPNIPLLGGNLVFMMASAPLEIALISRKRYRWAAFVYGADLLRVVFFLVPLVIWQDLRALLAGGMVFGALRLCAALFFFAKEFAGDFRPDLRLLRTQFAYALPFELAVIVEIAQAHFHQYAVSHYFDAATFAIYSVGCLQIPLTEFVASPAGNVMMVLMSEKRRQGLDHAVISLWHDTTRKLALIFFPLVCLLIVTARDLIPFLFTEQYRASVPIFLIWMTMVLLSVLQTDAVLRVFAATRFLVLLNAIRLFVVAGFIYVSISRLGIIGAVLATVLATAVAKGLALAKIRSLIGAPASRLLPWRPLASIAVISLLSCVGPLLVRAALNVHGFSSLALSAVAYAAIYSALLLRFGVLSTAERVALAESLQVFVPDVIGPKWIRKLSES